MKAIGLPVFECQIPRVVAYQRIALADCLVRETVATRAKKYAAAYEAIGEELLALIEGMV